MKRWVLISSLLLLLALASPAWASEPTFPVAEGWVNDFAGVLSPAQANQLYLLLDRLETDTGVEVALVTVDTTAPLTPFSYGVKLFEAWGIGKQGIDNGLLVLLAMEEREIRVEVGYGLEHVLTDSRVGAMLDEHAVPSFRDGDMAGGLEALVGALATRLTAAHADGSLDERPPDTPTGGLWSVAAIMMAMFAVWGLVGFLVWRLVIRPSRICPECKGRLASTVTNRVAPGISTWGSADYLYTCAACGYSRTATRRISPTGRTGTRGGRSSFGGGRSSFGGGRSGGGGAGRRW